VMLLYLTADSDLSLISPATTSLSQHLPDSLGAGDNNVRQTRHNEMFTGG
jgi:hypothetical protein